MKTNPPGDFELLAQAAIHDEATDAQLEALESAIMERTDGADLLRDMAMAQSVATPVAGRPQLSLVTKVVLFGTVAAAASFVALIGAGLLYFQMSKSHSHKAQLAAAPEVSVAIDPGELNADVSQLAADSVPEPSTSLLLVSGLTLFLLRRRR